MANIDSLDPKLNPPKESSVDEVAAKRHKMFLGEVGRTRQFRRKLVPEWSHNTDMRRGKPFTSASDNDRIAVNMDWMLTDQKHAMLFSQIPRIYIDHAPQTQSKEFDGWLFKYEQKINDTLRSGGLETAMDEVIPDNVNAAGIGLALVAHEAITQNISVPQDDLSIYPPQDRAQMMQSGLNHLTGQPLVMREVPQIIDHRYTITRISPTDFLWDLSFTGSDFNKCSWIGRDGKMSWGEAKQRWNLSDSDKSKYVGGTQSDQSTLDRINHDTEITRNTKDDMVFFTEIWYNAYTMGIDTVKAFDQIGHLVFLGDCPKPVVDGPWNGQAFADGTLVGAQKYPLQALAIHYISDDPIPPSDSAIGRPQVNELNKGRTQSMQQREFSRPSRWVDINRIDPTILQTLLRGEWQVFIPVQGAGTNVIGEVSRSAMPQENMVFDRTAKADLYAIWNAAQEQSGVGVETSGEAKAIAAGNTTVMARQRAKVAKFICNIAEVLGGLISINEDPAFFGEGFDPRISKMLSCSILIDSTVLLDAKQRIDRLESFLNNTAKSGFIELEPILREYAQLSGLDPSAVVRPPKPAPPRAPSISLRLTGTEDLLQPLTLAFLMESGQAPSTETINKAKDLIAAAVVPPSQTPPAEGMPGMEGPPPEGMSPMPPGGPGPDAIPPVTPPGMPPVAGGEDNPNMGPMRKGNQRVLDRISNE